MATRFEQETAARLDSIRDIAESGVTELTGKTKRVEVYAGPDELSRFGSGFREMFPELRRLPENDRPKAIAAAIRRGKGKVFDRVRAAVRYGLHDAGMKETRRRSEKPTIAAHERITAKCHTCGVPHGRGAHRFHGAGAFHQTHLFSFNPGGAMNTAAARKVFGELMKRAQARQLTWAERAHLVAARKAITAAAPRRNAPKKARGTRTASAGRRLRSQARQPAGGRPNPVSRRKRPAASRPARARRARGVLENPRLVRMGELRQLWYKRDHGAHRGLYKHEFSQKHRSVYYDAEADTILIK